MKKKIILVTLALSLSSFAFAETLTVEKVYAEDGSLDIPTYPILDKRTLSASRGGDRADYDSTIDGMGVKIVGKKGEAVDTVYGQYNTLLRSSTRIKSINSMLADGEIQGSISALRTICENPDYGCTPGLNKNTVTQQCENNSYCADSQMEFDGTKCFSNGTKLVSALMTPSYSCTKGNLEGTQCRVDTTKLIPSTVLANYSCSTGVLQGTKCKVTNYTYITATNTPTYKCTTGSLEGTKCRVPSTKTVAASSHIQYTCPSGYAKSGTKCSKTVASTYAATRKPAGYTISAASTVVSYGLHGIQKSGNYFRMITNGYTGGWVTMSADGKSIKSPGYSQARASSSNQGHHIGNRSGGFGYAYYNTRSWVWSRGTTINSSNNISSNLLATNNKSLLGFQRYNGTHFKFRFGTMYGAAITWVPYGTSYSCPSGGILSGSTCSATTVSTIDATAKRIYTCSAGSLAGTSCINVPTTKLVNATPIAHYSCLTGSVVGNKCKIANYTYPNATNTPSYECASGKLIGQQCEVGDSMLVESKMTPIYSCDTGSLEGTKCRVPDSFLNQALMTPIYTCASGVLETDRCRVPNNVEAPALCAAGTFSAEYAKCIAPLVKTCK